MPRLFVLIAASSLAFPPQSFRVMTFNVQHGIDGTHRYNLQRSIDAIAKLKPDLVALQEVTRNHSKYACDDQAARIASGLTQATGRTWHYVYEQEWVVNRDRRCLESGKGDGPATEGLAFVAPEPITRVAHKQLWNGRLGLAVRVSAAGDATIIVTHLAHGSRPRSQADRTKQLAQLLAWAEAQGTTRVIVGDMNSLPDAPELAPMMRAYRDAWTAASAARTARGVGEGVTRVGRDGRIDYVFFTPDAGLRLEGVETIDTSALIGEHASDHHPVVASFRRP